MMGIEFHKAEQRGRGEADWLHSRFSFSFADYYDPKRMGFGKLRVLNDDIIEPGAGFDTHPHDNMEIITIVTECSLRHTDSTGSTAILKPGDIQVMSAGSGILHSESNASDTQQLKLFQIWIEAKEKNIQPRHEERRFTLTKNRWTEVVSGKKSKDSLYIHQDARIFLGNSNKEYISNYKLPKGRGIFMMVIKGDAEVEGKSLKDRDAITITEAKQITIKAKGSLLAIEVPL